MADIFYLPQRVDTVRIRVERTQKFVASEYMPAEKALGGQTLEQAGIDPDTPLPLAATQMIRGWAASRDGIIGYMAQWGLLEREVRVVHHVKVFVDGQLVHEEDLP